jgi:hypothetical protein
MVTWWPREVHVFLTSYLIVTTNRYRCVQCCTEIGHKHKVRILLETFLYVLTFTNMTMRIVEVMSGKSNVAGTRTGGIMHINDSLSWVIIDLYSLLASSN